VFLVATSLISGVMVLMLQLLNLVWLGIAIVLAHMGSSYLKERRLKLLKRQLRIGTLSLSNVFM
jgi:hypothetical protein